MQKGDFNTAIGQFGLKSLGAVLFKENTANVSDATTLEQIRKKWDSFEGGRLRQIVYLSQLGHTVSKGQLDLTKLIRDTIDSAADEHPVHLDTEVARPKPPIDCPVISLTVPAEAPPPRPSPARLLVQTDSSGSGGSTRRFFATSSPAVITVEFDQSDALNNALIQPVVDEIRRIAPNRLRRVELGPKPGSPGDASDNRRTSATRFGRRNKR